MVHWTECETLYNSDDWSIPKGLCQHCIIFVIILNKLVVAEKSVMHIMFEAERSINFMAYFLNSFQVPHFG